MFAGHTWRFWLVMTGVLVALMLCLITVMVVCLQPPFIRFSAEKQKQKVAAESFTRIRSALENYATEHGGTYPYSLPELTQLGYLQAFPNNPYTGQPVRALVKGDEQQAGCVIYLPKYKSDGQTSKVTGYVLLLLGSRSMANAHFKSQVEEHNWIELSRIISSSETQSSPKDRLLFE